MRLSSLLSDSPRRSLTLLSLPLLLFYAQSLNRTQAETQSARPNAAAEFRAIMDELSDADENDEEESSVEGDEVDAIEAASLLAQADVDAAPQTRLAFLSGSNTLARVPIVART